MATVQFTKALKRFFPQLEPLEVSAKTVLDLIVQIESRYPGMKNYLLDNSGAVREHVNIFIGEEKIKDLHKLSDQLRDEDEVFILQALSGG